ncbi:Tautomerase enzyme [Kutzneria buriramensis]|uniref:Phenylpyruvate tautomerase PptA (4-oxalocrotonate tautomerase family) n=1 Tax=Kutzneria buriramensis TaxID=1045776 RepID=A0A3E0GZB6_9PSEU|nr:Tautomerase enzyme [Kutzneria buriramensis]REH33146.1 phenylpyruvate tautomerase PptA (4-oxalocrotonate tautomerase family) [Kutzneria buriramensis]
MPMLDVHIPDGALTPAAEAELVARLTEILVRHEGFDPTDPATLAVSWVFVHRPAAVYVGGKAADAPRYKVVPSVPEGQLDAEQRAGVVREVTAAILAAENGAWPPDPSRVWVFPTEIPEGHWGGTGRILPLAAILTRLTGNDEEQARKLAAERIERSRAR